MEIRLLEQATDKNERIQEILIQNQNLELMLNEARLKEQLDNKEGLIQEVQQKDRDLE